jgi:glycosyltransferase involved in cell wall biosynthesis
VTHEQSAQYIVTGYDEYIKDNYNALVVEQEDIEGAKNAVSRLIEDKVLREEIIRNGYETAKSWSDWEKSIDTLEKLYFSDLAQ